MFSLGILLLPLTTEELIMAQFTSNLKEKKKKKTHGKEATLNGNEVRLFK